jgi:hypothetical protein
MNPMLMQQLYAQALGARRQPQQPQQPRDPRDAAYQNLRQIGMSHEQAIDTINQHMQSQQAQQQKPMANPMQQGDQLTNNATQQHQGHGTASAPLPDNGFTHD